MRYRKLRKSISLKNKDIRKYFFHSLYLPNTKFFSFQRPKKKKKNDAFSKVTRNKQLALL